MRVRLEKSPEVKRLLAELKRIAPHILFCPRDRARHYAVVRAKGPPPWETVGNGKERLSDAVRHAAPLQPIRSAPDKTTYNSEGKPIPKRVKRGISGGLVDKLK